MPDVNVLAPGEPAPGFTARDDRDTAVSLSDFAGKTVVLYFYPKDDTSGCTKEALAFSAMIDDFEAENTVVIGVSRDSVAKHAKFRDKHDLKVILISDADGSITENYGVWVEKAMYGKKYMGIERATFLIGGDGNTVQVWRRVKVAGHAQEVLEAVRAMT